jgi:hypothetical protein
LRVTLRTIIAWAVFSLVALSSLLILILYAQNSIQNTFSPLLRHSVQEMSFLKDSIGRLSRSDISGDVDLGPLILISGGGDFLGSRSGSFLTSSFRL